MATCLSTGRRLLKPVVPQTHLNSIELRIACAQIGVGDMPPAAANVESLPISGEYLNAASATCDEVEIRRITQREVSKKYAPLLRPARCMVPLDRYVGWNSSAE